MTDKQELYTILKAYEIWQCHVSAFPDRSERPGLSDEEYDALSEKYDAVLNNLKSRVFELLDNALRRAMEDDNFWEFSSLIDGAYENK